MMETALQGTSPSGHRYELEGKLCRVWPYLRGHFSRDFLYRLWLLIEAEGDWPYLFWDSDKSDTPVEMRGDLVEWIHFMETMLDPKTLLLVQSTETQEIAGMIWFNKQKKTSAFGSIWISKKYRGALTREAISLGLEFGFYMKRWSTIYAITPWTIARNLLLHCGFKEVAKLRDLVDQEAYLMCLKEEDYGR